MTVYRTPEVGKLGSKFIKAKPLLTLLFVFTSIILCIAVSIAMIITGEPETISWIFLITMIFYIITICRLVVMADICFNALVANDDGTLIYLNLGNVFMNPKLFGEQYHDVSGLAIIIEWFKAAKRMKMFQNETDFDNFIMSRDVLSSGHYVKKVFQVKVKKKYIIAKVRLKQCNAVNSNMLTEFTKTIRIPKKFINSDISEMDLQRLLMI